MQATVAMIRKIIRNLLYPFQKASGIVVQVHFWAWLKFALTYQNPKHEKEPVLENDQQIQESFRILSDQRPPRRKDICHVPSDPICN